MKLSTEETPRRLQSDQLIVEKLATELMIFDPARNKAFCLNQKAAFVWQHCDGNTTIAEIAKLMEQALAEPIDEQIVRFALATLAADGLLEPPAFEPMIPAAITRRNLMRKMGYTAATTLPVVTAMLVATPKAHASSRRTPPPPPHPRWPWW